MIYIFVSQDFAPCGPERSTCVANQTLKDTDCLENEHCRGGNEATLKAGTCEEKTPNCRSKYDCGAFEKCLIKETWNGIKEGWCVSIDGCFEDSDCIPGQTCEGDIIDPNKMGYELFLISQFLDYI